MTTTSINAFKTAFFTIDWVAERCAHNPAVLQNGRTSIDHAADCYVALAPCELSAAKKLIRKHFPVGWRGWPVALNAARKRRRAFLQAVAVGTFSDNSQEDNYVGNYFYSHQTKGIDFFRHRRTFIYVLSPASKRELEKHESRRAFGIV